MKATLRIHISIHIENEAFDLNWAHAGTAQVVDQAQAQRFLESLAHNIESAAEMMSVVPLTGEHVPDLALAKGGDQEPKSLVTSVGEEPFRSGTCTNCGHGPGYHSFSPEGSGEGSGSGRCWYGAPQCSCVAFALVQA